MTDWKQHDGGPQPVADNVWVETSQRHGLGEDSALAGALDWRHIERSRDIVRYRILNQHLIDEARLEGIRLGLEAAVEEADYFDESVGAGLRIAKRRLLAETIAREAVLDQLTREAQADNMGYDND